MATLIERDLVLIGLAHSVKVIVARVRRKAAIAVELQHGIEIRPKLNLGPIPARYGLQFGNLGADQVGLGIRLNVGYSDHGRPRLAYGMGCALVTRAGSNLRGGYVKFGRGPFSVWCRLRRGNSLVGQLGLFALIRAGENRVALRASAIDCELLTLRYCIFEEFGRLG